MAGNTRSRRSAAPSDLIRGRELTGLNFEHGSVPMFKNRQRTARRDAKNRRHPPSRGRKGAVKKVPCKTGNQSLHGKRLPVSSFFLARVPFLGKRQRHQLVSAHGKTTQYHFSCRISCVTVYLNCISMLLLLYIASSSGTCAY